MNLKVTAQERTYTGRAESISAMLMAITCGIAKTCIVQDLGEVYMITAEGNVLIMTSPGRKLNDLINEINSGGWISNVDSNGTIYITSKRGQND